MTSLCFLLEIVCLLLERQMVVILPILLERQWRWPSTILSGEPLFYLEPLLIRLFSFLFSGPPPLIRGGAARWNIRTSKFPHGLFQHNPEIHSRVQIPAAHAHEHSPAEH